MNTTHSYRVYLLSCKHLPQLKSVVSLFLTIINISICTHKFLKKKKKREARHMGAPASRHGRPLPLTSILGRVSPRPLRPPSRGTPSAAHAGFFPVCLCTQHVTLQGPGTRGTRGSAGRVALLLFVNQKRHAVFRVQEILGKSLSLCAQMNWLLKTRIIGEKRLNLHLTTYIRQTDV